MILNWSHLNLRRHNFDFHLCNTVVAVDLFVVAAVAVAVPAVVAVDKRTHEADKKSCLEVNFFADKIFSIG